MTFDIALRTDGDIDPMDVGELKLKAQSGEKSRALPPAKCYMVFIEIGNICAFVQNVMIGSGPDSYTLPSGETVCRCPQTGDVIFAFKGLEVKMPPQDAALQVGIAAKQALSLLADFEDKNHSVILDLRNTVAQADAAQDT